ncbi:hypothetical protein FKM82_022105 [Ascaphus truei]
MRTVNTKSTSEDASSVPVCSTDVISGIVTNMSQNNSEYHRLSRTFNGRIATYHTTEWACYICIHWIYGALLIQLAFFNAHPVVHLLSPFW